MSISIIVIVIGMCSRKFLFYLMILSSDLFVLELWTGNSIYWLINYGRKPLTFYDKEMQEF